ncbi:MAG: sugar transferase [Candidatus Omnitrophica bacterium]|nr:sugar transferase [Candidatus Omnitrophota bacterium]MDD5429835.1 sugar transferase [Candidatus Omnitrophota bacterium]
MPGSNKKYIVKYSVDKAAAFFLMVVCSPILLAIILSITIEGLLFPASRGPLFVSEPRVSQGKTFRFFKFRKVKRDVLEEIKENRTPGTYSFSEFQHNPGNLTFTGKILKKFYLDEFPQLLNVLKGDISLVGPRAHPPQVYKRELERGANFRQVMRSGLTGVVAITKGISRDQDKMDAEYYKKFLNYSSGKLLLYDMWIIFKTIELIFKAKGY